MKKNILLVAFSFLVVVSFLSCQKHKSGNDDPGNIPGMGDAGGELEVEDTLSFPIESFFVGDIAGCEANIIPADNPVGSGGEWVILDVSIQNITGNGADFYLLGGSVIECQTEGYQHAICIQRIDIFVEAETTKTCKLLVYCINKGRSGSSPDITYLIKGVSSSNRMMRLVEALANKKIDIRDYLPDNKNEFKEISKEIQDIVWAITNGSGLSDEDWTFINSLPLIEK
ncbi:hypothetical protein EO244_00650 [Ancylomarina salipaludis]|uniref:Uncharacterized protein n=1 Tax=Ancylomarina salipaludis TaxID=2501299 RepID=A0A4Q1JR40_9BACT|nr:hypothetical protein [Ancylomarina salipaludis]RXQ97430.1 hypothetical protein EO244_00650 [Ancylomarina salipaludis]